MQDMFVKAYMKTLENVVTSALVTDSSGGALGIEDAVRQSGKQMRAAHDNGNRLFFIGNGGSAGRRIRHHLSS
jgi:phosphoheptose isomerase